MLHFPKKWFRWDCMLKLLTVGFNQLAAFPLVGLSCTMWTPFSIFSFEYNYCVSENHGLCFVTKTQKTAMGLIYEIYHWSLYCLFPVSDESQMYLDYWLFLTYSFGFLDLIFCRLIECDIMTKLFITSYLVTNAVMITLLLQKKKKNRHDIYNKMCYISENTVLIINNSNVKLPFLYTKCRFLGLEMLVSFGV